ncbi:MAG: ATP-binding domain-containing protein [bacterium]
MPFLAFEGPAGTGKTYQLIEEVRARAPELLGTEQRVLGLTFMHGSRRRLDESFAIKAEIRGRGHAVTIDSFAAHVVRRWSPIAPAIPDFTQFDHVCNACGALLERPEIARWVSAAFPIVAIDEAQELKPCRLRIAQALSSSTHMVVAADEFQCLDDQLDTGPFMEWFETGNMQRLNVVRRTGRQGLLNAGIALRAEQPPTDGVGLRIRYDFPAQVKFTIGHAMRAGTGTRAILVAPGSTAWANELIPQLAAGFHSPTQDVPPLPMAWDTGSAEEARKAAEGLCGPAEQVESAELVRRIKALPGAAVWLSTVVFSVDMARRAHGVRFWMQPELLALCGRKANAHRAYGYSSQRGIGVMTIHAAKNRQFRDVVILWGPGVPGTADHQRRLLYNAITRAEHSCTVMVRTQQQLQQPPFT